MTLDELHNARERLKRDGVVCLRGVLKSDEIAGLRSAVDHQVATRQTSATAYDFESIGADVWKAGERLQAGVATRLDLESLKDNVSSDPAARPLRDDHAEGGMFLYEVAGWRRYDEIRSVAMDSALPEIAAHLMDCRHVHFWEDTTFVKSPGTAQRTAFHQDLAYFQIEGDDCIIAWMPLDTATLANGVVQYVRGSHLWPETFAPNVFVSQTTTRGSDGPRLPDIEANPEDYDIVSFDVEPGDVIIHNVRTVHGAGGNPSTKPRRAISFRYCADTVRYFDRPGAVPQVGLIDKLSNGDPLFSRDYPIVWPKPWPGLKLADIYNADLARVRQSDGMLVDA